MTCDWCVLCQELKHGAGGKFSLIGVFVRHQAATWPASLSFRFVAHYSDIAASTVLAELRIVGPDGLRLDAPQRRQIPTDINGALLLDVGMTRSFPSPGPYRLEFDVDGVVASATLRLSPVADPAATARPM